MSSITLGGSLAPFNNAREWNSVDVEMSNCVDKGKMNILVKGPIITITKEGSNSVLLNLSILDYNVAVPNAGNLLTLTSIYNQKIVNKFTFKTPMEAYEACIFMIETSANMLACSKDYKDKITTLDFRGIVHANNNLSPAFITITSIENNAYSVKISKIMEKGAKAVFMGLTNNPNFSVQFAYEAPAKLQNFLIPKTLAFADLRKPNNVVMFVMNSPQNAVDLLLPLELLSIQKGGMMPIIVMPEMPTQEVKKAVSVKKPDESKHEDKEEASEEFFLEPAKPVVEEEKHHHHHHHHDMTPEEKEEYKKKKAEKKAKKEAESDKQVKITPEPSKEASKPVTKPLTRISTTQTIPAQTVEKKPLKTVQASATTETKHLKTMTRAATSSNLPDMRPRLSFTLSSNKPAEAKPKINLNLSSNAPVDAKPKVNLNLSSAAPEEAAPKAAPEVAEKAEPAEKPEEAKESVPPFDPPATSRVTKSRRMMTARKVHSIASKAKTGGSSITRHRLSSSEPSNVETIHVEAIATKEKREMPHVMDSKLKEVRERINKEKKPAELKIPSYDVLLGSMTKTSVQMTGREVNEKIDSLDSLINEFDFDALSGLPEFASASTEDVISEAIDRTTCINDSNIASFVPMNEFPDVFEDDFKYAETPSNPFLTRIMSIIEVINISGATNITNESNGDSLSFIVASILINGFRGFTSLQSSDVSFLEAFNEFSETVSGLEKSINIAKKGATIGAQLSLFAASLLNNECFIPTLNEALNRKGWVNKHYLPSAMLSNYSDVDVLITLLTPIITDHSIALSVDESLFDKVADDDIALFVLSPAYPHCSIQNLFQADLRVEEEKQKVIQELSSYFTTALIGSTDQMSPDKLKKLATSALNEVADQKHGFGEWSEFAKCAKAAAKSGQFASLIENGFNQKKIHLWFAYFIMSRRTMTSHYFADSLFCDFYKSKRTFTVLEHMMRNLK